MSFQLGATADKASDIRKRLQDDRDSKLRSDEYNASRTNAAEDDVQTRRDELEGNLADAGIAGIAAAARELKASGYQVTVSGHRNPDGQMGLSMAINASP